MIGVPKPEIWGLVEKMSPAPHYLRPVLLARCYCDPVTAAHKAASCHTRTVPFGSCSAIAVGRRIACAPFPCFQILGLLFGLLFETEGAGSETPNG